MSDPAGRQVASVAIVYRPRVERLAEQIQALSSQVARMIYVDNGGGEAIEEIARSAGIGANLIVIRPGRNTGVAGGLNLGIASARQFGAELFLLLDQDSVPPREMVAILVATLRAAELGAGMVAAVGPRIRDRRDLRALPFIRLGLLRNIWLAPGRSDAGVECDFLITSGCLVADVPLKQVGAFDEGLFIDSVDLEWCLRARSKSFRLIGCGQTALDHELGERRARVPCGIKLVVHPPLRLYYMTRNRILLYRRPYVPVRWKIKDFPRMILKCISAIVFLPPRSRYLAMSIRGVLDGLRGRTGCLELHETGTRGGIGV